MGRKRRIRSCILSISAAVAITGCDEVNVDTQTEGRDRCNTTFLIENKGMSTRSSVTDENKINDLSLIIFEDDEAERTVWRSGIHESEEIRLSADLVKGRRYTFFVIANLGKETDITHISELKDMAYEIAPEDSFSKGIPMSALYEDILIENDKEILISLERMAAKISIRLDRSRMSKGVDMNVQNVRIGNYPRYVSVLGPSRTESVYDRFDSGFMLSEDECGPLNTTGKGGLSQEVSLFMLENMQGDFPSGICEDEEKVLDENDPLYDLSSFIEMEIHYTSSELVSYDSNLRYRFYLGDGLDDLNVERNSHYHITVCPEDDGLSGGGWRVDKTGIGPSTPVFEIHPGEQVEGHVGDTVRIWCECYPRTAPFHLDYNELNYDKSKGIYDYSVDEDEHGVTLYLKKPGIGIVYMSAGEPINQSGMAIVSVLP